MNAALDTVSTVTPCQYFFGLSCFGGVVLVVSLLSLFCLVAGVLSRVSRARFRCSRCCCVVFRRAVPLPAVPLAARVSGCPACFLRPVSFAAVGAVVSVACAPVLLVGLRRSFGCRVSGLSVFRRRSRARCPARCVCRARSPRLGAAPGRGSRLTLPLTRQWVQRLTPLQPLLHRQKINF